MHITHKRPYLTFFMRNGLFFVYLIIVNLYKIRIMIIGKNHVIRIMLEDKDFAIDTATPYHPELKKFIIDGRTDVDNLPEHILNSCRIFSPIDSNIYIVTHTVI